MAKYNVTMYDATTQKITASGYYDDAALHVDVHEIDGSDLIDAVTYGSDALARAAITSEASSNGWVDEVATVAEVVQETKVAKPRMSNVFAGVVTAAQNIHGVGGTITEVQYDNTSKDTTHISHTDGTSEFQFLKKDNEYRISAPIALLDVGLNNRNTYGLKIKWTDSLDVVKREWLVDDTYVRDDNIDYDSGVMGWDGAIFPELNDKLIIQVEVLDEQTPTGTVSPDTTESQIWIDQIYYQVSVDI